MILDDFRDKLTDDGIVEESSGWKCYTGFNPDQQDKTVTLQFTGGFEQDTHQAENLWQSVQIVVRAGPLDYNTCYAKWREVYDAIHDVTITAAGIFLCQSFAGGPMTWTDEKKRINMSMNLRVGVSS